MNDLAFYIMLLGLIGLLIVPPLRGSKWIEKRFGPRQSSAFTIFILGLVIALVAITWIDVAASLRQGGSTAAMLTPFTMLMIAIPLIGGVTLLWMGTLWAWERLRS